MLESFVAAKGDQITYCVAFSGGVDSLVLLHALYMLRQARPLKIKAIHINHNLQHDAAKWVRFCESICHAWQIDFVAQDIYLDRKINIEESARKARYQVFQQYVRENDLLLTAHHQDDQAETVLLQLLRGAGPQGLSAMPKEKAFGKGWHCRPLLDVSRRDIMAYAEEHQLQWVDDPSNANSMFARNFLRNEVLPLLQQKWPSVTETLTRVADNCREAQQIVMDIAKQDIANLTGSKPQTLSITKLAALSPERQRQVIRVWLQEFNFPLPSQRKLVQLQQDFLTAAPDRFPHISWKNVELRRFNDDLYAMRCLPELDSSKIISIDSKQLSLGAEGPVKINLAPEGDFYLLATQTVGAGLRHGIEDLTVRFRQGGERCRIQGKGITQDLKKIFQEKNIPTWERGRVPLIYAGGELVAVPGYFIVDGFAPGPMELGWSFEVWIPRTSRGTA